MNSMFNDLFEKVISLWPNNLAVSEKIIHASGGASIPMLTAFHDAIEKKIIALNENEMLLHMDWAIYTVLHQMARQQDEIVVSSIDRERVREIFERNLKNEGS